MTLRQTRTRRRLSITSLIDVIFLLLLFFMLASTFSQFSEIEMAPVATSGAQGGSAPADVHVLLVDQTALNLDGAPVSESDLVRLLHDEAAAQPRLDLHVGDGTDTQRLIDILAQLKPLDGLRINMVGPS